MRNTPAGKREVQTPSLITSRFWTLGFDGKRGHMEKCPLPSEFMHLICVSYFLDTYIHVSDSDFQRNMHQKLMTMSMFTIQSPTSRPTTQDLQQAHKR